jgi:hypothetical protein
MFLAWSLEVEIVAVELMTDLFPLRRSGSSLAISEGD